MKNKTPVTNILILICNIFIIAGCGIVYQTNVEPSESVNSSEITNTLTPRVTDNQLKPTRTRIPTRTPILVLDNPTPVPTLTFDQQKLIIQNVLDENCVLPCYLGITPGVTTLDEIIEIVKGYGGFHIQGNTLNIQDSTLQLYTFTFDIDIGHDSYEFLRQRFTVYIFEGTVVYINVHIGNRDLPLFYEYWSRYSAQTLIPQLGMPETVHIRKSLNGNDFLAWTLTWDNLSIVVTYGDDRFDDMICPRFSRELVLNLSAPGTWQHIPGFFSDELNLDELTRERDFVHNVLGIDKQQFLDQILSNENICFESQEE